MSGLASSAFTLYRVIAVLLLGIAVVLVVGHDATASGAMLTGAAQMTAGVVAGFVIGIVAALLGVAGGELLIPTLVLLFGADIKLAGSLSLAVSLRYSRDRSFVVLGENRIVRREGLEAPVRFLHLVSGGLRSFPPNVA
jgi:uncharacterized protein